MEIEAAYCALYNCSYTPASGGAQINITPRTINWSAVNRAVDSGEFVAPVITIQSPENNLRTQQNNILFNISVSGVSEISTRFYSLDHGIINISFDGDEIVNLPEGSYHPFFCVNGSIDNLNCTQEIGISIVGEDFTQSPGGGDAADDDIKFTLPFINVTKIKDLPGSLNGTVIFENTSNLYDKMKSHIVEIVIAFAAIAVFAFILMKDGPAHVQTLAPQGLNSSSY